MDKQEITTNKLNEFATKSKKSINELTIMEENDIRSLAIDLNFENPSQIITELNYIKNSKEDIEPETYYKVEYSDSLSKIKKKTPLINDENNYHLNKDEFRKPDFSRKHKQIENLRTQVDKFSSSRSQNLLFAVLITTNIIMFCVGFWASWYYNAEDSLETLIKSTSKELIIQTKYHLQKIISENEILIKTLKTSYEYGALYGIEEKIDENLARIRILKIMELNEVISSIVITSEDLSKDDSYYQEIYIIKEDKKKKYYEIKKDRGNNICHKVEIEGDSDYLFIGDINCPDMRLLNTIANSNINGSWSSPTNIIENQISVRIFCLKSNNLNEKMIFCLKFPNIEYSHKLNSLFIPSMGSVYVVDYISKVIYGTSNLFFSEEIGITPVIKTENKIINMTYNILKDHNFYDIDQKRYITSNDDTFHLHAELIKDVNNGELLVVTVFIKDIYMERLIDAQYITISTSFICVLCALLMAWISYYVTNANTVYYSLSSDTITNFESLDEKTFDEPIEFYSKINLYLIYKDIPKKHKDMIRSQKKYPKMNFKKIKDQQINERSDKMIYLMIGTLIVCVILAGAIFIAWHKLSELALSEHEIPLNNLLVDRLMQSIADYTKISEIISYIIRDHIEHLDKQKEDSLKFCSEFLEDMLKNTDIKYYNYKYHVQSLFIYFNKNKLCSAFWDETKLNRILHSYQNEKDSSNDNCLNLEDDNNDINRMDCNFLSTDRLWYKETIKHLKSCGNDEKCKATIVFSGLYTTTTINDIVSSACSVHFNENNEILGFSCADIYLRHYGVDYINQFEIYGIEQGSINTKTRIFILDKDFMLVTSSLGLASEKMPITTGVCQAISRGEDFDDEVISSTTRFISKQWDGNIENITVPQAIDRIIEQPITWISNTTNNNWKVVFTVEALFIFGSSENLTALAFIMCVFASLITITCVSSSFVKWKRDYKESTKRTKEYEEIFGVVDITEEGLETLLGRIKSEVLRAFKSSWFRKYPKSGSNPNSEHRYKRAKTHVKDAERGKNILRQCILDTPALGKYPLIISNIQLNYFYRFIIYSTVFTHILIGFWDPPSNAVLKNGVDLWVLIVEGCCIFIQIIDIIGRIFVLYKEQFQIKKILKFKNETINSDIQFKSKVFKKIERHKINFLSDPKMKIVYSIRCILITLLLIDLIFKSTLNWSFEYYLPIRPFIIIFMSRTLRRSALLFIKSIVKIIDALILFAVVIMVSSIMALILFRGLVNSGVVNSSFDNYIRSVMTMFVFISSGENYPNIVYPAIEINPIYLPFFIIWSLFGLFVIVAIVTGVFQDGFSELQKSELKKRNLRNRVGLLSAFALLDEDLDDKISRNEFSKFMRTLKKDISDENIEYIFKKLDKIEVDDKLDIKEFVDGVEEMSIKVILSDKSSSSPNFFPFLFLRVWVFEMSWWDIVLVVFLLCDAFALSLYGLSIPDKILDLIGVIFLSIFVFDVLLKLIVFGPFEYWDWAVYHKPGLFKMFANRSEIVITSISLISFVLSYIIYGNHDYTRFTLSLILLRLFTQIRRLRYMIFSLFQLIPSFSALLLLLLVLCYFYGYLGMGIFSGKYILLDSGIPSANFENLLRSMITLYQLTIGESWHDVMYNTILATNFLSAWYFISFIFLVNMLYTSLVIGLILSVFGVLVKSDHNEITSKELDRIVESTK